MVGDPEGFLENEVEDQGWVPPRVMSREDEIRETESDAEYVIRYHRDQSAAWKSCAETLAAALRETKELLWDWADAAPVAIGPRKASAEAWEMSRAALAAFDLLAGDTE